MRYLLVFTGQIKEGVSRKQTLALLCKLSKLSPEQAEARFFSGKAVKLKAFSKPEEAKAFLEKLQNAGLLVKVLDTEKQKARAPKSANPVSEETPTSDEDASDVSTADTQAREAPEIPQAPSSSEQNETEANEQALSKADATAHKKRGGFGLKIAAAAVILLIAAGGGAFYWLNSMLNPAIPEQVIKAENALYSNNAVLVGHINVGQLASIESTFGNPQTSTPKPNDPGFFNQLNLAGIDFRKNISNIVFTVNESSGADAFPSLVILGDFKQSQVDTFLNAYFEVSKNDEFTYIKKQDRLSCEYSPEKAIQYRDGFILVSNPESIEALSQSIAQASSESSLPQEWQNYRDKKLASIGLLQPSKGGGLAPGMIGMMLGGVVGEQSPLQSAFFGISGKTLPPGITANLTANVNSPEWLAMMNEGVQKTLSEAETKMTNAPNIVKEIFKTLSVVKQDSSLSAEITVSKTLVDEIQNTVNNGLSSLISFGGGSSDGDNTILPESIDEEAKPYAASVNANQLPDFENSFNKDFLWQEGPAAITIDAARINKDGLLEVEIVAQMESIPNIGDDSFGPIGELNIKGVFDSSGNNLLRVETCGMEINSDPSPFKEHFSKSIQAVKTVRLKEGAKFTDIDRIEGELTLNLATKTRSQVISAPIKNKALESGDLALTIDRAEFSTVDYTLSGDFSKLLQVRALNGNNQYLRKYSGGFFGGGKNGGGTRSMNQQFQGEVKSVEVIFADEIKPLKYDFTLNDSLPAYGETSFTTQWTMPNPFDATKLDEYLKKAEGLAPPQNETWNGKPVFSKQYGPILLDLYQPKIQPGFDEATLNASYRAVAPYNNHLTLLPNILEFTISQVITDTGETVLAQGLNFSSMRSQTYQDPASTHPDAENGSVRMLATNAQLQQKLLNLDLSDRFSNPPEARQLKGFISLKLPTALKEQRFDLGKLGEPIRVNDLLITPMEFASNKILFKINGNHQKLADLVILNAEGVNIGFSLNMRMPSNFDKFKASIGDIVGEISVNSGKPSQLAIVTVEAVERQQYPVLIEL